MISHNIHTFNLSVAPCSESNRKRNKKKPFLVLYAMLNIGLACALCKNLQLCRRLGLRGPKWIFIIYPKQRAYLLNFNASLSCVFSRVPLVLAKLHFYEHDAFLFKTESLNLTIWFRKCNCLRKTWLSSLASAHKWKMKTTTANERPTDE